MTPDLSIVIPAYNEATRLPPALDEILAYLQKSNSTSEIIVVDDGSSDRTAEVVNEYAANHSIVSLHSLSRNQGKGAAVKAGVLESKGELVLFCDADGSTPFSEIERLKSQIDAGADVAIASRALSGADTAVETSFHRKALGRLFNKAINIIVLPGIADTQCGFKLFTKSAAKFIFSHQRSTGFSFDLELLYIARKAGLTIKEVPVNWHNVPGSKVNLLLDAIRMFRDALKIRSWHSGISPEIYRAEVERAG